MGGLDPAKLLVILVLALVVLGPERLPKAARQVGALWRDFTLWRERLEREVRDAVPDLDLPPLPAVPGRGLTGYLTGLMTTPGRGQDDSTEALANTEGAGPLGGLEDLSGRATAAPFDVHRASMADLAGQPGRHVAWSGSNGSGVAGSSLIGASAGASPLVMPNGVPASWGASGAETPGYASGSVLTPSPSAAPEGILAAEVRIDLDDPSWN